MKVFILSGSNNKINSTSERLAKKLAEGLEAARIETATYLLSQCNIKYCEGCNRCFNGKECAIQDDMPKIKQDLLDSDVVVIISPVYIHSIPAPLKNFLDRIAYMTHRMTLAGKGAAIVTVSASNGNAETEEFLDKVVIGYMGASPLNKIRILKVDMSDRVQDSYIQNLIDTIRYFKRHPELHATEKQEEVFKMWNTLYSSNPEIPEAKIWFAEGYHLYNRFEDIICKNTKHKMTIC